MRRLVSFPSNADVRDGLGAAAAVMSVFGFSSVFSSSDVEEKGAAAFCVSSMICGCVVLWKSKSDSSEIFSSGIEGVVISR